MTIEIIDTRNVEDAANTLIEESIKLESVKDSIEFILKELKDYWEQTQEDAKFFYSDLEKNKVSLEEIVGCNKDFGNVIINYAEKQNKTSQISIN